MQTIHLEGTPPVEIALRRSRRARRLSLRVSSLDGRVTMTVPFRLPIAEAVAFANERFDWIVRARAKACPAIVIAEGVRLPVEGTDCTIALHPARSPKLDGARLLLPRRAPGRAAMAYLKLLARDRLTAACDGHAAALGRSYAAVTLRDTRSRWGSCSHLGRLMFSWRLAMAPPEVLNYVAAHEVAHLERMDHSPAFWALVEGLDPDWETQRDWLRTHGAALHAYRFTD